MADTTEKKTYLIDIEHNFDEYNDELVKAKKNLEDAKAAVDNLKTGQFKSREEIEKANTAYRAAQKEYSNAKKNVDSLTQANKANAGSYNELYQQWQLAQTQLKNMGSAYTVNEKGVRVLSEKYIEQSKIVDDAKISLDAFGKGIHSNTLNVGNYSESMQGALKSVSALPGPIGSAATATAGLGKQMWLLVANPVGAIIAAIAGVLMILFKAFKGNDEASEKFGGILKGIGVVIKEVLGRVVSLGQAVVKLFKGDFKGAAEEAKEAFTGFGKAIKDAYTSGNEQAKLANEIEDDEIAILEKIASRNKQIAEIKKNSRDEDDSALKRKADLLRADDLAKQNLEDQLVIQQKKVKLADMELTSTNKNQQTDEMRKKLAEERAKLSELETQSIEARASIQRRILALDKEMAAEKKKALDDMEEAKKKLTEEIDAYKESIAKQKKADTEALADKKKAILEHQEWERNQQLQNQENLLAIREQNEEYIFDTERARIELQHQTELDAAIKTGADINIINAKYSAIQRQLTEEETNAKLSLYAGFAGNLATIFGENTKIGKAAAIAQTTIATYQSAVEAYKSLAGIPIVGPVLGFAAAGAAIVAGIANVKKIMAVNTNLKSGGSSSISASMPTAISSSPAAQRNFAGSVGSTILSQPQLSQTQLNSLPQNSMLTAESIAQALSKLPAPVVTVEDINARTAEKNKVEVRANI